MTAEDVIKEFREDAPEDAERAAYANELFQEAIRLGMELNNQYHTPEEIRDIMCSSTPAVTSRTRAGLRLEMAR